MSDMVKRVGRAIWLKLSGPELDECEEAARAAIEAMRDPTDKMVLDGAMAAANENPHEVWEAMIDAALKPERAGV
jgi:hypothetical protein